MGHPLLSNFRLSKVFITPAFFTRLFTLMQLIQDVTGASFTQTSMMDSCRHFAPETLVDDGVMSRASDIYALGMTILEVIKASPAFVYWSR